MNYQEPPNVLSGSSSEDEDSGVVVIDGVEYTPLQIKSLLTENFALKTKVEALNKELDNAQLQLEDAEKQLEIAKEDRKFLRIEAMNAADKYEIRIHALEDELQRLRQLHQQQQPQQQQQASTVAMERQPSVHMHTSPTPLTDRNNSSREFPPKSSIESSSLLLTHHASITSTQPRSRPRPRPHTATARNSGGTAHPGCGTTQSLNSSSPAVSTELYSTTTTTPSLQRPMSASTHIRRRRTIGTDETYTPCNNTRVENTYQAHYETIDVVQEDRPNKCNTSPSSASFDNKGSITTRHGAYLARSTRSNEMRAIHVRLRNSYLSRIRTEPGNEERGMAAFLAQNDSRHHSSFYIGEVPAPRKSRQTSPPRMPFTLHSDAPPPPCPIAKSQSQQGLGTQGDTSLLAHQHPPPTSKRGLQRPASAFLAYRSTPKHMPTDSPIDRTGDTSSRLILHTAPDTSTSHDCHEQTISSSTAKSDHYGLCPSVPHAPPLTSHNSNVIPSHLLPAHQSGLRRPRPYSATARPSSSLTATGTPTLATSSIPSSSSSSSLSLPPSSGTVVVTSQKDPTRGLPHALVPYTSSSLTQAVVTVPVPTSSRAAQNLTAPAVQRIQSILCAYTDTTRGPLSPKPVVPEFVSLPPPPQTRVVNGTVLIIPTTTTTNGISSRSYSRGYIRGHGHDFAHANVVEESHEEDQEKDADSGTINDDSNNAGNDQPRLTHVPETNALESVQPSGTEKGEMDPTGPNQVSDNEVLSQPEEELKEVDVSGRPYVVAAESNEPVKRGEQVDEGDDQGIHDKDHESGFSYTSVALGESNQPDEQGDEDSRAGSVGVPLVHDPVSESGPTFLTEQYQDTVTDHHHEQEAAVIGVTAEESSESLPLQSIAYAHSSGTASIQTNEIASSPVDNESIRSSDVPSLGSHSGAMHPSPLTSVNETPTEVGNTPTYHHNINSPRDQLDQQLREQQQEQHQTAVQLDDDGSIITGNVEDLVSDKPEGFQPPAELDSDETNTLPTTPSISSQEINDHMTVQPTSSPTVPLIADPHSDPIAHDTADTHEEKKSHEVTASHPNNICEDMVVKSMAPSDNDPADPSRNVEGGATNVPSPTT